MDGAEPFDRVSSFDWFRPPQANLSREGFGICFNQDPGLPTESGVLHFGPPAGWGVDRMKQVEQGLIQVYTGEGKGKTTAAVGLAVRALGQGLRVLLVRLLKPADPPSGEVAFLQGAQGLEILTSGLGVIGRRPDREAVARNVVETFAEACRRLAGASFDLVIFDEINNAVHRGYLPLASVLDLLENRPGGTELVLTGRHAPAEVLQRADLITRLEAVRHPLKAGIAARRGIEY